MPPINNYILTKTDTRLTDSQHFFVFLHVAAELARFMRASHCETSLKQVLATRTKKHCSSGKLGKCFRSDVFLSTAHLLIDPLQQSAIYFLAFLDEICYTFGL